MKKIFEVMTDNAKSEVLYLIRNKENALDMLANNYFGKKGCGTKEIVNRFQVQYFALDPQATSLQSDGKDGWWQNEEYEANTVNGDIAPLIETETTENEWGKKYYSSFALNKEHNSFGINFPLRDNYLSTSLPFKFEDMSQKCYENLVNTLQEKLSVKIVNQRQVKNNYKKSSFVSGAFAKIKNRCLMLVRKYDKVKSIFKGSLFVADKSNENYAYSNVEKTVKIYDALFTKVIRRKEKALKDKVNKHLAKDIKLASRILANLLMCRATNFGNVEINKKVEKCLSLQFANVLNKNSFISSQLNLITEMASGVVCELCKKMGRTTEDIANIMMENGFVYETAPENEKQALLLAKEKDYMVYMEALKAEAEEVKEEPKKDEDRGIIPNISFREPIKKDDNTVAIVPSKKETQNEIPMLNPGREVAKQDKKNSVAELAPTYSVVEYRGEEVLEEDSTVAKNLLKAGEETLKLSSTGKRARVLEPGEIAGLLNSANKQQKKSEPIVETLQAPAALAGLPSPANTEQLESSNIAGYLRAGSEKADRNLFLEPYNSRLPIELDRLPFLDKIRDMIEENISTKKLSKKSLIKYIDKQMEKTLVEYIVKITNAINANRCSKYGGKVKAKRQADVLAMVLAYYKKRTTGKLKTTKATQKNFATLYSRCQQLTSVIFCIREDIINKIMNISENTPANTGESTKKYINRLAKEVCKIGDPEGVDIQTYVTKMIDSYSSIYADGEFTDIYDKNKK